jgi:hypothetical protein
MLARLNFKQGEIRGQLNLSIIEIVPIGWYITKTINNVCFWTLKS